MADRALNTQGGSGGAAATVRLRAAAAFRGTRWGSLLRPFALILVLQAGLALLFLLNDASGETAGLKTLPIDDAWTRLIYARNFGDNLQLQFNAGSPEAGATSLLWVVMLGLISTVTGPIGLSLVAVAKLLGILFASVSALLVFSIIRQLTGLRRLALVGAIIVAIEPGFGFAALSGMEVTLYSMLALASSLAFLKGKQRTAGALMALMVLTRPESWVIVIIAALALLVRRLWDRNEIQLLTREDSRALLRLVGPAAVVSLIWAGINLASSGSPLPNAYYATREDMGLLPFGNVGDILQGYYHHLAFFSGVVFPISFVLVVWGGVYLLRRYNYAAAPIALFIVAQTYAIAANLPLSSSEFTFNQRRFLDPVIPFVVILLAMGLLQASRRVRTWRATRSPTDPVEARVFNFSLNALLLVVVVVPFVGLGVNARDLPFDYSWNSKNTQDSTVAAAMWIRENTPEDALIATDGPGGLGFFSDRTIFDLSGVNSSDAIDKPAFDAVEDARVDFVFVFASVYFNSWPQGGDVYDRIVDRNTVLPTAEFKGYQAFFDRVITSAPRETPYQISFSDRRLQVIDTVDVGNGDADKQSSESTHEYVVTGISSAVSRVFRVDEDITLEEDARTFTGYEEFQAASRPGQRLLIAKRYDAAVGQSVRVSANGQEVGVWDLQKKNFFFGEAVFEVPGEFITAGRTRLRFELIPAPGQDAGNSFFYWILVDENA